MKVSKEQIFQITLVLNKEEATWLHSIMQNPLHGQSPDEEDTMDAVLRHRFFDATRPPE